MRIIQESQVPARGPWVVQRRCPEARGGCGAIIEITIADLIFTPQPGSSYGNYVCPCCGLANYVHVPHWARMRAENPLFADGLGGPEIHAVQEIILNFAQHLPTCPAHRNGFVCNCGLQRWLDVVTPIFGRRKDDKPPPACKPPGA